VSSKPGQKPAPPKGERLRGGRSPLTPQGSPSYDVDQLRRTEFPWTEQTVYLNNASVGPLPERTRRVLEEFNQKRAAPFQLPDRALISIMAESRRLAAELVGAVPEEIALTINTGFGLSLAARALPLGAGDIVLASDREFPANVYPWMLLKDIGVTLELAPTTPQGWPDEEYLLDRLQDPRVRVLAVSLVQFSNGYTVDLARLSTATRAAGAYLVVDAIQALGQLPLDPRALGVHLLATGGQKWLCAPFGTGFTWVARELVERAMARSSGVMDAEELQQILTAVVRASRSMQRRHAAMQRAMVEVGEKAETATSS
jgi:cysteine desulfurase / selenocysteine lyase